MWQRIDTRGRRYMVKRNRRGQIIAKVTWGDYLSARRQEREMKRDIVREVGKALSKSVVSRWLRKNGWEDHKDLAEALLDLVWDD